MAEEDSRRMLVDNRCHTALVGAGMEHMLASPDIRTDSDPDAVGTAETGGSQTGQAGMAEAELALGAVEGGIEGKMLDLEIVGQV